MKTIVGHAFMAFADSLGIGYDGRYPNANQLHFTGECYWTCYWKVPDYPSERPYLFAAILGGVPGASRFWLFPRFGGWPAESTSDEWDLRLRDIFLKGIGATPGWPGALRFEKDELPHMIALLFTESVFPGSVGGDIYIVPDNGRLLLQTDHHGVIHALGKSSDDLEMLKRHMEASGYNPPLTRPDPTFKRAGSKRKRRKS